MEFGSNDATVEDEKYRPSPIATEGLQIVLRATFKIYDSKRFLLLRLKELIQNNYELLDQSPQSPTATDEEEPHASNNEEDLLIGLIDDEAEEDKHHWHWQCNNHKTGLGSKIEIATAKWNFSMFLSFTKSL